MVSQEYFEIIIKYPVGLPWKIFLFPINFKFSGLSDNPEERFFHDLLSGERDKYYPNFQLKRQKILLDDDKACYYKSELKLLTK
jgi:hypothetical protein